MGAAAMVVATASGTCYNFTHGFILEFPPSNALTHNLVSVRLLGPHSAVLGQPIHLTWLVTRISSPPAVNVCGGGAAAADDGADVAVYDVVEAADAADGGSATVLGSTVAVAAAAWGAMTSGGATAAAGGGPWQWRQALGCRGSIRLGRAKGSVAVVEAVMLPMVHGVVRAPVLRLRGLREVREEDAGTTDYVVVSS
ncbi:hypothetical protein Vretifemale_10365 [Volvox reticuliferus]|nr:hypothetical protein Vretifemale_10365 [Volvox reticuliferus]